MLLVKTTVGPSRISGLGLFAEENIKKGQTIWRYHPDSCVIVSQQNFDALMDSAQNSDIVKYFLTYGFYVTKFNGLLQCLDNARFVNHSNQPNLTTVNMSSELSWQFSVASCDIEAGSELTESYETYDTCDWFNKLCSRFGIFNPIRKSAESSYVEEPKLAMS